MMKNRILQLISSLILLVIVVASMNIVVKASFATDVQASGGSNTVIWVGYSPMDVAYVEDNGRIRGYVFDLLDSLNRYEAVEFKYIEVPQEDQIRVLLQGQVDLVTSVIREEAEANQLSRSSYPVYNVSGRIYALIDSPLYGADYTQFNNIKVGYVQDSGILSAYEEYEIENHFQSTNIEYTTVDDLNKALENGEIDACTMSVLFPDREYKTLGAFDLRANYFAGRKNSAKFQLVDKALKELNYNETETASDLYTSYVGQYITSAYTKEEQEIIDSGQTITIAMREDTKPLMYQENETMLGYLPETLNQLSKNIGIQIKYKIFGADISAKEMAEDPEVDFVAQNSLFIEADQLRECSNEFAEDEYLFAIRKDSDTDVTGELKIGTIEYNQIFQDQLLELWPNGKFKFYDTIEDVLEAVSNGEIEAGIVTEIRGRYLLKSPYYSDLTLEGIGEKGYGFVLTPTQESSKVYLSIINKGIDQLKANKSDKIARSNVAVDPYNLSATEFIYKYKMQSVAGFLIILLLVYVYIRIQQSNRRLDEASKAAELAIQAKTDFLANMSHELRTPLNALIGLSELLEDSMDDVEMASDYANKIKESAGMLGNIISDILDMSAIEQEQLHLNAQGFNIIKQMALIASVYEQQCKEKDIQFTYENDALTEEYLVGDPYRIRQIILNLLSNAVKFTEAKGRIQLVISEKGIDNYNVMLEVMVSDTGSGISVDMQKRLFNKFEQESSITVQKHGGSGLGLSITKSLVKLMNGEIQVSSVLGEGSQFMVSLPMQIGTGPELVIDSCMVSNKGQPLSGMCILLVEDNDINKLVAQLILEKNGAMVDIATDGQEAVNLVLGLKKRYDVVLMDIQMPIMDGYEATRRIRLGDAEYFRRLPIYAMTADSFQSDVEKAIENGMNGHISKPIEAKLLVEKLEEIGINRNK